MILLALCHLFDVGADLNSDGVMRLPPMPDMDFSKHLCIVVRGSDPKCVDCPAKKKGFCAHFVSLIENLSRSNKIEEPQDRDDILALAIAEALQDVDKYAGAEQFGWRFLAIYKNKRADYFRNMRACYEIREEVIIKLIEANSDIPLNLITKLEPLMDKRYLSYSGFIRALDRLLGTEGNKNHLRTIVQYAKHPAFVSLTDKIAVPDGPEESSKTGDVDMQSLLKRLYHDEPDCVDRMLYVAEGHFNQKELAEIYGEKPNTFNVKLRRCRKKLRRLLEKEGWE
jgi:hypothetical protein